MFVLLAISDAFDIPLKGYKPYIRFQNDFSSISYTYLRLQTLCFQLDFCNILYTYLRLQASRLFSVMFQANERRVCSLACGKL